MHACMQIDTSESSDDGSGNENADEDHTPAFHQLQNGYRLHDVTNGISSLGLNDGMERIILHEEDHGILWKNQDWRTGLAEVRRMERLKLKLS